MADVGRANPVLLQQCRLEREDAQHVIRGAPDLLHPLRRQAQIGRTDEVDGADAALPSAPTSRSRLKSGASTPMKAVGGSRSRRSRKRLRMPTISG
jgi:hypothetical protein